MNIISENTLIPISMIIVLAGGIAWLTTLHVNVKRLLDKDTSAEDHEQRLSVIESEQTTLKENFSELKDDIREIKDDIKTILAKR